MKMGIKIRGDKKLVAELRNTTDRVKDAASKFMKRSAERIAANARLNAPVDLHNLEESIHVEKAYEEGSRRLKIEIVAGGIVGGVNVDEYAAQVHENYNDENPGKGTQAKRDSNPDRSIGSKYLENALEKERDGIENRMLSSVVKELPK